MEIDEVWYPAVTTGKAPAPEGRPTAYDAITVMLEKFCEWLNIWMEKDGQGANDPTYRYKPDDFYNRKILAAYESWDFVVVAEVHDGDEGGSNILTGYFPDTEPTKLRYLIQEFDTEVSIIWGEPKFLVLPEEREATSDN